mmetsp:Transcript_62261/g.69660  ORF Transcript_62261/g.69660 Transcript_62261/m.69660 type:complete len:161 (+) Transcript_62261:2-484(+)
MINTGLKESVEYFNPKKVNAKEWTTFYLGTEGHSRKVQSYEVTLGDDVKRIQIGWRHGTNKMSTNKMTIAAGVGVGDVAQTFALDLTRSTFLFDGNSQPIDRLEYKKGTTIRTENFGLDWYINGEIVYPSSKKIRSRGVLPLISIKGEMEITSIQLEEIK